MAGSFERPQRYLRDRAEPPPAHRGSARPTRRRPDPFSRATRPADRPPGTPLERLYAGEFQGRLVVLLAVVMLAVVIVTVST